MNKTCSRCQKTVYPIEELKCLDKIWHKGCFKCQECNMTLNMKTYKGYGKLPYCEAHVPKAKHTTMAETPELRRIAENTRLQSNVTYHADFEKSKGKFTQVADDPETLRIKANTQIISNVAYHGELAKKAAMEKQRTLSEDGQLIELPTPDNYDIQIESYDPDIRPQNPQSSSQPTYQKQFPSPSDYTNSNQPPYRKEQRHEAPPKHEQKYETHNYGSQSYNQNTQSYHQNSHSQPKYEQPPQNYAPQPKYEQPNYNQAPQNYQQTAPQNYQQTATQNYQQTAQQNYQQTAPQNYQQTAPQNYPQTAAYQQSAQNFAPSYQTQPQSKYYDPNGKYYQEYGQGYDDYSRQSRDMIQREQYVPQGQRIGKIEDYDPVTDGPRQQAYTPRPSATLIYNSSERNNGRAGAHSQQANRRPIGNVNDLDPLATETDYRQHAAPPPAAAKVFIAMYDYEATDTDEVSFREGDLISVVTSIDEGWMTGKVLRTGRTGMLPANYVEPAPM